MSEERRQPPLQNRVMPTGEIVSHPGRGLLMGNRGCIHRDDRTLGVTRWRSRLWICCVLDYQGWKRDVMPPGRWTALFFLDEATALAAGHRPCGYCREADHRWFGESWRVAQGLTARPRAFEMDAWLHAERVDGRTRRQRTREVVLDDLPDGAMVSYAGGPRPAHWRRAAAMVIRRLRPARAASAGPPGRPAHAARNHCCT